MERLELALGREGLLRKTRGRLKNNEKHRDEKRKNNRRVGSSLFSRPSCRVSLSWSTRNVGSRARNRAPSWKDSCCWCRGCWRSSRGTWHSWEEDPWPESGWTSSLVKSESPPGQRKGQETSLLKRSGVIRKRWRRVAICHSRGRSLAFFAVDLPQSCDDSQCPKTPLHTAYVFKLWHQRQLQRFYFLVIMTKLRYIF